MKSTAIAPTNIAFIKYWGRKDEVLRLPTNGSISMNLSDLLTTTTVDFSDAYKTDEVIVNGEKNEKEAGRVIKQLDRIRKHAYINTKAKVVSVNNFPSSTGLSSSASGFAALTLAAAASAGLKLNEKNLSILARQGSGSSCRSIPDGFVEWIDGDTSDTSYAHSLFPADWWDIRDIVVIVSDEKKQISSTEGQKRTGTSPFMSTRLELMSKKITLCKKYIKERDFTLFGELLESEALEMHAIMLTSRPSLIYWLPTTITLMKAVQLWRKEGLSVYFTINTGQDIHLICQSYDVDAVKQKLTAIKEIKKITVNSPAKGAYLSDKHLF